MNSRFYEIVRMPADYSRSWSMGFYRNEELAIKEALRLNQKHNEWTYYVTTRTFEDDK